MVAIDIPHVLVQSVQCVTAAYTYSCQSLTRSLTHCNCAGGMTWREYSVVAVEQARTRQSASFGLIDGTLSLVQPARLTSMHTQSAVTHTHTHTHM